MARFIARRVIVAVVLIWAAATALFVFLRLIPGNPVLLILSGGGNGNVSPAAVAALKVQLGLNRPLLAQYGMWLGGLVHGNLGRSLYDQTPVLADVMRRLPRTLELLVAAVILGLAAGIPSGLTAAIHRKGPIDRVMSLGNGLSISTPVFVVGTLLVLVFAVALRWFPAGSYVSFASNPLGHLRDLTLPAVTLGFALFGPVGRMTRASVLEALRDDYVRTASAKGLAPRTIRYQHVLRNALIPVVTLVGLQAGNLLGGTVLVEVVFNWPGMSTLMYNAVQERDYPIVQGTVLVIATLFILINLAVDISYAYLDPRLRFGQGRES